ncbi:MAG: HNH endonuclease [Candidatus Firestonebacteria bacterium]
MSISNKTRIEVWNRDHWICRYCNTPVFFAPTLKLFNELSPDHCYYHPNGKEGEIIPVFQWGWASVDHVHPKSKGGEDSLDNFVTSCWKCNLSINNKTKEQGKPDPIPLDEITTYKKWDGLSSLYPVLSKKRDEWVRLLENSI